MSTAHCRELLKQVTLGQCKVHFAFRFMLGDLLYLHYSKLDKA